MTADLLRVLTLLATLVKDTSDPTRDAALEILSRTARQAIGTLSKRRTILDRGQVQRVRESAAELIKVLQELPTLEPEAAMWPPVMESWLQPRHGTTQG